LLPHMFLPVLGYVFVCVYMIYHVHAVLRVSQISKKRQPKAKQPEAQGTAERRKTK
jgi:hypothetical protein